jgi:hypothetical protein
MLGMSFLKRKWVHILKLKKHGTKMFCRQKLKAKGVGWIAKKLAKGRDTREALKGG